MGIVEAWIAEGNTTEAKAALEKLLAMPGLPAPTKAKAEGMLKKLA